MSFQKIKSFFPVFLILCSKRFNPKLNCKSNPIIKFWYDQSKNKFDYAILFSLDTRNAYNHRRVNISVEKQQFR